jgi:hypothetical protein
MCAALPVDPPRIGKDPNADKVLAEAAADRLATANTTAPKTPERMAETRARIEAGNAAEKDRKFVPNATLPDGGAAAYAERDKFDRHGQLRPDPTVMDPPRPKAETAPGAAPNGVPAPAPSTPAPAAAEVVPKTQGPRPPRKVDALDEPPMAAFVPYAAPNWALSTQPASAGHAFSIAVKLHNSRRWMGRHDSPEQIAAVILRGRELGIGMMTALDAFHVIQGRVCASSQLISALAENDPNHDYTMLVELDEKHAVVEIKHKKQPKPVQWTYTIGEAEALGLTLPSRKAGEPSQWVKRPKTMLAKTAKANGHRFMFPGSTLGLHSLETEVDGQEHISNDD